MKRSTRPHKTAPAFTLMEVLIVIAIIAALAALTIAGLGIARKQANDNRTKVLIEGLDNALENYKLDNGEVPDGDGARSSSIELYQALYADEDLDGVSDEGETIYYDLLDPNAKGNKLNISKEDGYIIVDAWKNPIYYRSPGEINPDFDIWSLGENEKGGPNAIDDSDDDHSNY